MADFDQRITPWAITLVMHNWPIMIYSIAVPWAAVRAFLRPSRPALLLLYGLLTLALAFEYQKHGLVTVLITTEYVFALLPAWRDLSQQLLLGALPVAAHLLGGMMVVLSLLLPRLQSSTRGTAPTSK